MVKALFLCESRLIAKIVKIKISEYQRDFSQIPIRLASTFAPRAILVITRLRPSPSVLPRYAFISIHINNWNNVRSNKYLLRAITNVNFRRYSAFRCRVRRKASWDRSPACHASAFAVKEKKKKGKARMKRRGQRAAGGTDRRGRSTNLTKHPFSAQAGSFSPPRRFLLFIFLFFFFYS